MKTLALSFSVVSDLYVAGRREDGTDFIAEQYYVVAEDARGNRWSHNAVFNGCRVECDDEDYYQQYFIDIREEAHARADKLLARIRIAPSIDMECWEAIRPAYGSLAYQEYGQFDDWMEEQMEQYA